MKNLWMRSAVGVVSVLMGLMAGTALGANDFWTNTSASGNFEVGANWSLGVMPGSADRAVFTNRIPYTVNIAYPVTNTALDIVGGQVTFSTPGSNYTFGSLQITNSLPGKTNELIISGAVTVTVSATAQSYLNNPTKPGAYKLTIQDGAKMQFGSVNALYLGPNGWSAGATSIIVVAGAGSALHAGNAVQMNSDGLNAIYVTNGGNVKCSSMNLNKQDGNVAYVHRALLTIGGGSTESLVSLFANTLHNNFAGPNDNTPNDKVLVKTGIVRSNTTETILLPNGRLTISTYIALFPGATLTLAGGTMELTGLGVGGSANNMRCGGVIRGSGTLNLANATGVLLLGYRHSTDTSITNFGSISPGMSDAPIGTIVISNAPAGGYLAVSTNCSLNFDLAGTSATDYDRILATNSTVYLGAYASPYTVQGGSIINVALTNNWKPTTDSTFDVLVATNIMDTDLLRVTFNYPTQQVAGFTWSASIITNTVSAGKTNEVLRITAKGGAKKGTLITIW